MLSIPIHTRYIMATLSQALKSYNIIVSLSRVNIIGIGIVDDHNYFSVVFGGVCL